MNDASFKEGRAGTLSVTHCRSRRLETDADRLCSSLSRDQNFASQRDALAEAG
jgi:hypothetical protein